MSDRYIVGTFGNIQITTFVNWRGEDCYFLRLISGSNEGEGMGVLKSKFDDWIDRFYTENF